jgi:N-acetyltransferase
VHDTGLTMSTPFNYQPTLTGTLLAMRPFTEADFELLYAVASDPEIWALHPFRERYQRPVFRKFIDDAVADRGGLVAVEHATGRIVGYSRYSHSKVGPDEIEIGWTFLERRLWGGTWNRDMKRIMLAHALAGFPRVIFRIGEENLRSRRAMEKIGGVTIPWNEVGEVFGRPVRHIAYTITREVFARWD